MSKYLLLICIILTVIYVESSWLSYKPMKSSNGKLKISIEYGSVDDEVNKCDDECKGNCNNTCGTDARCRFNCYVEQCRCPGRKAKKEFVSNGGLLGCTTKCREYCNNTCGEDLKCRKQCYVKTCQCPPPEVYDSYEITDDDIDDDDVDSSEAYKIPQKPQCCPVCMSKCIHRCDKPKEKCTKYCKNKCCHDPSEWN